MKNPWLKPVSKSLRDLIGDKDFYGGRFPPAGQWFPTGRRIDPCSVCGCESVLFVQEVDDKHRLFLKRDGQEIWMCEKHEREYYALWPEMCARKDEHKRKQ